MLNIYIGKEALPNDKTFVFDVKDIILLIDLLSGKYVKKVLKEIDRAVPLRSDVFVDRFGAGMKSTSLSTTSQILLAVGNTDYIINGDELGTNGYDLLREFVDGNIYLSSSEFLEEPLIYPVAVNSNVAYSSKEFNRLLGGIG